MEVAHTHTNIEHYDGAALHWTNRVDASGSRIEWMIVTDSEGWTSRYGPVHNNGIYFGSRSISSGNEQKALLAELRSRVNRPTDQPAPSADQMRAA